MKAWFCEFANRMDLQHLELHAQENPRYALDNIRLLHQQIFGVPMDSVIQSSQKHYKTKILRDPALVERGIHVFRYIMAKYIHKHNATPRFVQDGKLILTNYLTVDKHQAVQEHINNFPIRENRGDNNHIINFEGPVRQFVDDESFVSLVSGCAGVDVNTGKSLINKETFVQRLHNTPNNGDIQKNVHLDTFFPAVKYFYFPDAVELGDGPFRLQTNNDITESYIEWLYEQSIRTATNTWDKNKGSAHYEGSFRATDQELDAMGISVDPVVVPANTLVIANVGLFHARGESTHEHIRNAIHGGCRTDYPYKVLA